MADWLTTAAIVTKSASSIWNRVVQDQETRKDLSTQLSNLNASYEQAKTQNTAYYALMKTNATNSTNRANDMLKEQTSITLANRDANVRSAGKTLADQGAIASAQIAQLMVQGSQEEGNAIQQSALSGFRDTGSATNGRYNVSETYRRSLALARAQADLQRYSNYQTALQNYTGATQQAELYKKQVEHNNAQLVDTLDTYTSQAQWAEDNLTLQYNQNKGSIEADISYMNSWQYWTAQGLGIGGDILGAASEIYGIFGGNGKEVPPWKSSVKKIDDRTLGVRSVTGR